MAVTAALSPCSLPQSSTGLFNAENIFMRALIAESSALPLFWMLLFTHHSMRELVFEPLGMRRTSILCIDSPFDTAPHGRALDGNCVPINSVLEKFTDAIAPAGSVWPNMLDMAQYLSCELRNGLNERGEQIIIGGESTGAPPFCHQNR
jgi:hypothetical protein